mmetsp:Transcript_29059/g.92757  ORF Transcript_29059/g.92757 Transcript_29059/m.92757 type:complete len:253 (+) Transcript_29059:594-1352(+)
MHLVRVGEDPLGLGDALQHSAELRVVAELLVVGQLPVHVEVPVVVVHFVAQVNQPGECGPMLAIGLSAQHGHLLRGDLELIPHVRCTGGHTRGVPAVRPGNQRRRGDCAARRCEEGGAPSMLSLHCVGISWEWYRQSSRSKMTVSKEANGFCVVASGAMVSGCRKTMGCDQRSSSLVLCWVHGCTRKGWVEAARERRKTLTFEPYRLLRGHTDRGVGFGRAGRSSFILPSLQEWLKSWLGHLFETRTLSTEN